MQTNMYDHLTKYQEKVFTLIKNRTASYFLCARLLRRIRV